MLFYFLSFSVNPRLCAAISNLRCNKGGKIKEKCVVVLAATTAMQGLQPLIGDQMSYLLLPSKKHCKERMCSNVVIVVITVKR